MEVTRKQTSELYWALLFLSRVCLPVAKMSTKNMEFADVVHFERGFGEQDKYAFGVCTDGFRLHVVAFDAEQLGRYFTANNPYGDWKVKAGKEKVTLEPVLDVRYPEWQKIISKGDAAANVDDGRPVSDIWQRLDRTSGPHSGFIVEKADVGDLLFALARCNIPLSSAYAQDSLCWIEQTMAEWTVYQRDTEKNFEKYPDGWERRDERELKSRALQALDNSFGGAVMFRFANPIFTFGELGKEAVAVVMPKQFKQQFGFQHPMAQIDKISALINRYADGTYLTALDAETALCNKFVFW